MYTLNRCSARVMSAVAVFTGIVFVSTIAAAAPEALDLKMDAITFDPPIDQFHHDIEKGNIKIKCQWSSKTTDNKPLILQDANGEGQIFVRPSGAFETQNEAIKVVFPLVPVGAYGGAASPPPTGEFEGTWTPPALGSYIVTCRVDMLPKGSPASVWYMYNNEKWVGVQIIAAKMSVGALRSVPKSATAKIVTPVPNPTVAGAQALIQSSCQSPEPALIARITIKNAGGPLAAGKGTLIVSGSPGLYGTLLLPQMNMGETKNVDVPVPSTTPYSKLSGNHPMNVYLEPYKGQNGLPNFGKPAAPYPFTAIFPTGHCVHRSSPPAAGAVKSLPNPPQRAPLR